MLLTLFLSAMMMAGLFLILWAEVGFIQDKRFASSCPEEELAVMPDTKPERFEGQHALGWCMAAVSIGLMAGAVVWGAWDGIANGFAFDGFFVRFLIMLLLLKAFDIVFFDWVLLCNKGFGFFTHYYPEVGDVLGPHYFGFNWRTHLAHIVGSFLVSAVLAFDWVTWDGDSAVEAAADAATREDAAVDPVPEVLSLPEQPLCLRFDQDEAGIIGWLEYVKACRSGRTALEGKGDPAIVRAWIATMETEMVCSGFASASDLASLIKPEQLIVQYCFRTQDAIDSHLVFESSFEIPL